MDFLRRLVMFFVRPALRGVLGFTIRHGDRLPARGPAILVANHNSHLDTAAILALFPRRLLSHVRPVAASDYFLRGRLRSWFALRLVGIVPIDRKAGRARDPLGPISRALETGDIVVLFPEGSRGEPERMSAFKTGIAHLAERHPDVPVVPIFMHGFGKALPKGTALLVPFCCEAFVGEPLFGRDDRRAFMESLVSRMQTLAIEAHVTPWA